MMWRAFRIVLVLAVVLLLVAVRMWLVEEQPKPQPEIPTKPQTPKHSVEKKEASSSVFGWWSSPPNGGLTYPPLGTITRIEIRTRRHELIHILDGQGQIQKAVAFVDKQRSGWGHPWYGVPVPKVVAYFYDGESLKGNFGAGLNFFVAQREGDFLSRDVSAEQCQDFLSLVGADKKLEE